MTCQTCGFFCMQLSQIHWGAVQCVVAISKSRKQQTLVLVLDSLMEEMPKPSNRVLYFKGKKFSNNMLLLQTC